MQMLNSPEAKACLSQATPPAGEDSLKDTFGYATNEDRNTAVIDHRDSNADRGTESGVVADAPDINIEPRTRAASLDACEDNDDELSSGLSGDFATVPANNDTVGYQVSLVEPSPPAGLGNLTNRSYKMKYFQNKSKVLKLHTPDCEDVDFQQNGYKTEDAAVICVQHTIQDNTSQTGTPTSRDITDNVRPFGSLGVEDDDHTFFPLPNSSLPSNHANNHLKDVTVEFKCPSRPKPPLRAIATICHDSSEYDAKGKLNKEGQRSWSLEVPSIRIRMEDEEPTQEEFRKRHYSADEPFCEDIPSSSPGFYGEAAQDSELGQSNTSTLAPRDRMSLPLNYAQRQLLTKSLGRSSGHKLTGSHSLDVPGHENRSLSLSLSTLDPLGEAHSGQKSFPIVKDKLISSSMSRLDGAAAGQRRRSWTPDVSPRGSKESIHVNNNECEYENKKMPDQFSGARAQINHFK